MRAMLAALIAIALPMTATATEEPPHTVILEEGRFELRQYDPMIVAEVEVTGEMRRAGCSGFRPLADYIFGNNAAKDKIEMTAPVTRTRLQKIEMTAPVTRTPSGDEAWTVAFVMPADWTMDTLPTPNNPNVKLQEQPGRLMAVVTFNGEGRASKFRANEDKLTAWIEARGTRLLARQATPDTTRRGYRDP